MAKIRRVREQLNAVANGEAINWRRLLNLLMKENLGAGYIFDVFKPLSEYDSKTIVEVIDKEAFNALLKRFPERLAVTDRVSAAVAGDSHQMSVLGGMLNVWRLGEAHPFVVLSTDNENWHPLPVKKGNKTLIIIENMTNFIRFDELVDYLKKDCSATMEGEVYIAYGAGTAASKIGLENYYKHFEQIECLFDLDVGGLTIYHTIKERLSHYNLKPRFLYHSQASSMLKASNRGLSGEELKKLYWFAQKLPELKGLITAMYEAKRSVEQEVYLQNKEKEK